jgi:hypothetical protein
MFKPSRAIRTRILVLIAVAAGFAAIAPTAFAAPPVLASVGSVSRHPTATWTLPPGVQAKVAEVATSPATGSDGYFFFENVKAFDVLTDTQTSWTDTFQLDPGTYYVHIAGLDEPCFLAGKCPVREFSQVMTLEIRPDTYAVSVTKLGAGTGTVTANGATISECGAATCTTTLIAGTSTFVATPAPDSEFAGWGGACSGTSTICTVTVDGPKSLSATFNKKSYSVSMTKMGSGTGTVTANGTTISECGAATCTATFTSGTSATFVATAAPDSNFAGWAGACSGTSPACTITVDGAKSITATFSKKPPPPLRCVVPSLKGKTIAGARTALKNARCALGRVTYAYSKVKKGHVISQRPAARTIRPRGSLVQIVVSYGPKRR